MFKNWLAYITDPEGRSYYIKSNGRVDTTSQKIPIEPVFEGYQEINIGFEREGKKLGVVSSFTLPIAFVKKVKKILRHVVFSRSINEKLFLIVQKLDARLTDVAYSFAYKFFYKAQLDLTSYRYRHIRDSVSVAEGGVHKLIKAHEGTTFDIDIDNDPEKVPLYYDGVELREKSNYIVVDDLEISNKTYGGFILLPVSFMYTEGRAFGVAFRSQNLESSPAFNQFADYGNFILQAAETVTIEITGTLSFTCLKNDPSYNFRGRFLTSLSTVPTQNQHQVFNVGLLVVGQTYTVNINRTITLVKGEKLYMEGIITGSLGQTGSIETSIRFNASSLVVRYKSRFRSSVFNCLKPSTVIKRLGEKMGLKPSEIDTTYVEQYDHLLLASGDSVRGITNSVLKTNLNDCSEFVRVLMAGSQGVEAGKLLFNAYNHFLNPSLEPIDLGEVKSCDVFPAKELMGNVLKAGYPKQEIDEVNGKASFNNTQVRTADHVEVKEHSFVCPYISDAYFIENLRITYDGKDTTDSQGDNLVVVFNTEQPSVQQLVSFETVLGGNFIGVLGTNDPTFYQAGTQLTVSGTQFNNGTFTILGALPTGNNLLLGVSEPVVNEPNVTATITYGVRRLRRVIYDSITGIPEPDYIYNIEGLTPYRIMLLQQLWINSVFYGMAGQKIKHQSSDRNESLKTVRNGVTIEEKADFPIGTDILFKPWFFEIETLVPQNLVEILEENPNRPFSFTWLGYTYKGFLWKAGISASDSKPQTYKLLCAPDCDLTTLIDE